MVVGAVTANSELLEGNENRKLFEFVYSKPINKEMIAETIKKYGLH